MPMGISRYLNAQQLRHIGRLLLQSRYVVEGSLAGRHRSPMKGASSEFADHRAYFVGDDPKHIDWKVLGRTERYYVRRYEDETNLRVYLVMDRSASMGYTSGEQTKYEYACTLAAAIGYIVVKGKDSVGMCLYSSQLDAMMAARKTFVHLNTLLHMLGGYAPASTTTTAKTLHQVAESIRRRAMIVLFSDLFDEPEEIIHALAHFRKEHHDVIVFHVLDPAEIEFPFTKGSEFEDLETGEKIAVDARRLAADYRKAFAEFMESYRKPCTEMNIDYRLVNTRESPELFIRAYLEERRRLSR